MRSMTGFGKARVKSANGWIVAEIGSVNRKQLEIVVALPRDWSEFENEIREEVLPAVSRGRVQVTLFYQQIAGTQTRAELNFDAARHYHSLFRRLQKELGIEGEIALRSVIEAPGVLIAEARFDPAQHVAILRRAVREAVADWNRMREREGRHLRTDLKRRLRLIDRARIAIGKRAPQVAENHRTALLTRIEKAGLGLGPAVEDDAFRRELFLYADRCDITEELTRLGSHLKQFEALLGEAAGGGRKMEFLLQELQREVNTVGSKANDVEISHRVVEAKSEIEKIREQVQNIE